VVLTFVPWNHLVLRLGMKYMCLQEHCSMLFVAQSKSPIFASIGGWFIFFHWWVQVSILWLFQKI